MTVIAVTFDTGPQTGSAAGEKLNLIWDTTLDSGNGGWRDASATSTFVNPTTFIDLIDTPSTYAGSSDFNVQVNTVPNALEFVDNTEINGGMYGA